MELKRGLNGLGALREPVVAAIGAFDGVHLGHRRIIAEAVETARRTRGSSVVLTFEPHPEVVLRPGDAPRLLTDLDAKAELVATLGVDVLAVAGFTPEFSRMEPDDFVESVILGSLRARRVVVGFNFSFGHLGAGGADALRRFGRMMGFSVKVFRPIVVDGLAVSSTAIRQLVLEGSVERAARLLGRPHRLSGPVVRSMGRGKTLGFPTANVEMPPGAAVPARGVYAVRAFFDGAGRPAVANVGTRPTFDGEGVSLEVHVLDFSGDLYGRAMGVEFVSRLRDERRFESPGALSAQLGRDVLSARGILGKRAENLQQ